MSSLPRPEPDLLASIEPPIEPLRPDRPVWRVYRSGGGYPATWNDFRHVGPVASRFDHHLGDAATPSEQVRGVYYCSPDLMTAVAEAFQEARHVDLTKEKPRLTLWLPRRAISLLDLWQPWVARAGCDQRIHTTPDRTGTRAWSRAFYDAYPVVEGLCYRSKMGGGVSWCLYERCADASPDRALADVPLESPSLRAALESVSAALGYSLDAT